MRQDIREKLCQALEKIDRPGTFCVTGSCSPVLPGLEVKGLGPIGLPLSAEQAKQLKGKCEQAPYGKGEETLVDTSVRRVWRLKTDRFSLRNSEWDRFLRETLKKVQDELGLEKRKLESHLHELLLYERGCFFLPHRDGEKLDGMVATLVIVLPCSYTGGELIVRHDGQEQSIDFGSVKNSSFQTHFAAFYADCEHEVRPLKQGHRLCLVYNLTLGRSRKPLSAPRESEHIDRLVPLLRDWSAGKEAGKLVVTLDHKYTENGLAWDRLKGVDRVKARVLVQAARQAGCNAYLALLTFWESGSADVDDGGYGYGMGSYHRDRWDDEDDDDEADEGDDEYEGDDPGLYEMDEVFETSLSAEEWSDLDGKSLPVGALHVDEGELLQPGGLKDVDPEEEFEGYTGNAGMTLDRWYRHAAVILWPERAHFEILCDEDSRSVVPLLKQMVSRWRRSGSKVPSSLREQCIGLASAILTKWPEIESDLSFAPEYGNPLKTLIELGEPSLIGRFLGEVMAHDASIDPGKALLDLCRKHGWGIFKSPLKSMFKATTVQTLERNVRLLERICLASPKKKAEWAGLCELIAGELVRRLCAIDGDKSIPQWQARDLKRSEILERLGRSLLATRQNELLGRVVEHTFSVPKTYPLEAVQIPALIGLGPLLEQPAKTRPSALNRWIAACRERLESLTAQPPQEPNDWRRDAKTPCKCADCRELRTFLDSPTESVHRFSIRQERRDHLEKTIRAAGLDLDLKTERNRSPHTLVCTKNQASYQAALKKYNEDKKLLAKILAMLPERS